MKLPWLPLIFLGTLLPACALFHRPPRPIYAPPQEAASFTWPVALPIEDRQVLSGTRFAAMQLAMEDFLPWDLKPHKGATLRELCLYKRDSYDMSVAPAGEGLVFVDIYPRPGACDMNQGPVLDMGSIYVIDTNNWRILAVHR